MIDDLRGSERSTRSQSPYIRNRNNEPVSIKRNLQKAPNNSYSERDLNTNRTIFKNLMDIIAGPIENFKNYVTIKKEEIKALKVSKEIENKKTAEDLLTDLHRCQYMSDIKTVERALTGKISAFKKSPDSDFYDFLCPGRAQNKLPFERRYNNLLRRVSDKITDFYDHNVNAEGYVTLGMGTKIKFPELPEPFINYDGQNIRDIKEKYNDRDIKKFFMEFKDALSSYEVFRQSRSYPLSEILFSQRVADLGLVEVLNRANEETFLDRFAAAKGLTTQKIKGQVTNKLNLAYGAPRLNASPFLPNINADVPEYMFDLNTDEIPVFGALSQVREQKGRLMAQSELECQEDLINFYKATEGVKGSDNKSESAAKYLTSFIYNYTVSRGMTTDPFRFPIGISAQGQTSPNEEMFSSIYKNFFEKKIIETADKNWSNFNSTHQRIQANGRQIDVEPKQFVAGNMIPKSIDGTMSYIACKYKGQETLIPIFKVSNFHVSIGIDPDNTSSEADRFTSIIASSTRSIKNPQRTGETLKTERHPEMSTVYNSPRNDDFHKQQEEISSFKLQFALIEQIPTAENNWSEYKIIDSKGNIKDLPATMKVIPAIPLVREDTNKLLFENLESQTNQAFDDSTKALFSSDLKVEINKTKVVDEDGNESMCYSLNPSDEVAKDLSAMLELETVEIDEESQFMPIKFPVQSN